MEIFEKKERKTHLMVEKNVLVFDYKEYEGPLFLTKQDLFVN